jgi:small subunit ribosomal protein S6
LSASVILQSKKRECRAAPWQSISHNQREKEEKSLNAYEITYIINPNVTEENLTKVVERFSEYINKSGGQVVNIDNWGKRKMAFEIKGKTEGFYINMKFNSTPETSKELTRIMRIDEEIVRSLVIRLN